MHTVLLVDDNIDVLQTLKAVLEQAGHRVIAVADAPAALSVIRDGNEVDVIVTDYRLPHMDGLEFLDEVRNVASDVPVVVLTGYGTVENYLKFISRGAFEYMNKPVLSGDLKRVVHAAVMSARARGTGEACAG